MEFRNKKNVGQPAGITVIPKMYDFILWMIQKIDKFPRKQKFILGERLEAMLLDVLDNLIKAQYSKNKREILFNVNYNLEIIRYMVRICNDLHFINVDAYGFASKSINEIGRMVGGWIKVCS